MQRIDYYFATLSPYCYLAGTQLEKVAAKNGAEINYKPFDILQAFPRTGGTPPKDRHISRVEYRAQALVREAKKLDMPFNLQPAHWPTNALRRLMLLLRRKMRAAAILGRWSMRSLARSGPSKKTSRRMMSSRPACPRRGLIRLWQTVVC